MNEICFFSLPLYVYLQQLLFLLPFLIRIPIFLYLNILNKNYLIKFCGKKNTKERSTYIVIKRIWREEGIRCVSGINIWEINDVKNGN